MRVERRGWVSSTRVGPTRVLGGARFSKAGTSRMNREVHVRFCGGLVVRFLRSTRRGGVSSTGLELAPKFSLWERGLVLNDPGRAE